MNGGNGRNEKNASKRDDSFKKKTLQDYMFDVGNPQQASDYLTTCLFVVNHIRKTYEYGSDIAMALEEMTPYNMDQHKPKLQRSTSANAEQKEAENEQFNIEVKCAYNEYKDRKRIYENNMSKAKDDEQQEQQKKKPPESHALVSWCG